MVVAAVGRGGLPGSPLSRNPFGKSWFALSLGVCLSLACGSSAPVPTGSVGGIAVDGSGNVLPGITVSLQSEAGKTVQTVITSEDGSYSFQEVSAGRYRVLTLFAGFSTPKPLDVTVETGMQIKLQPLVLLPPGMN
jgi:hypothetical protein